jgi:hypothetical protein
MSNFRPAPRPFEFGGFPDKRSINTQDRRHRFVISFGLVRRQVRAICWAETRRAIVQTQIRRLIAPDNR